MIRMATHTQLIKVLSEQAETLRQLATTVAREHVELSVRERALQRMVSQAEALLLAVVPASIDQPTCPLSASPPSTAEQGVLEEVLPSVVAPSTWTQQPEIDAAVNAVAVEGAQQLDVIEMITAHTAYIGRASVLVTRMNTPLARPGDLAELESLTKSHWANIVKTGMLSIKTLWRCYVVNFETGQVEELPEGMCRHVLPKVGLEQEQLLTLSAGAKS
jgi:hypothetical protein